jgi:hypothetical protein
VSNQFGPWATMIDVGGNPQLSSFWRRRLTMLVPASRARAVLSRRGRLWLAATAALMLLLPTVHFVLADEPAEKTPAAKKPPATKPEGNWVVAGVVATAAAVQFDDGPNAVFIPACVYGSLARGDVRKELKFTGKQEQELMSLSRDWRKRLMESAERIKKEGDKLGPAERAALTREYEGVRRQESMAARRQIEAILTAEQLTSLRCLFTGHNGLGILMAYEKLRKELGISDGQMQELTAIVVDYRSRASQMQRSAEAADEKILALVTPGQWQRLEQTVYAADKGAAEGLVYPSSELSELLREDVRKRLKLTDQQQAKIREIWDQSQAVFTVGGMWSAAETTDGKSAKENAGKLAAANRSYADLVKVDHDRLKAVLTAEQSAALGKIVVRREFLESLDMALFSGTADEGRRKFGLLGRIDISRRQWDDLTRFHEEREQIRRTFARDTGRNVLNVLSEQQQNKLLDVMEQGSLSGYDAYAGQPSTTGKSGSLNVVGRGVQTLPSAETKKPGDPANTEKKE